MVIKLVLILAFALTCSAAMAKTGVEVFGLVGADYMQSPHIPWNPGFESFFGGGASILLNSRLGVEGFLAKRGEFKQGDVHFAIDEATVTHLMGSLIVNLPKRAETQPFVFGGIGLLHFSQTDILFNGPLPADDSRGKKTSNHLGLTAGAGVKAFFHPHVALRPEFRFTYDLQDPELDRPDAGRTFLTFSVGIVFAQ